MQLTDDYFDKNEDGEYKNSCLSCFKRGNSRKKEPKKAKLQHQKYKEKLRKEADDSLNTDNPLQVCTTCTKILRLTEEFFDKKNNEFKKTCINCCNLNKKKIKNRKKLENKNMA